MWIYGYNEAKQMVEVNVPLEHVLAEQIDPWRLDLCDPDPVVCETREGELRFRRLRDIAFAYGIGKKAIVCVHDGSQTACLESTNADPHFRYYARMNNARSTKESFAEHLKRFIDMGGFHHWYGVDDHAPFAYARASSALKITAGTIELSEDTPLFSHEFPIFTGEMFRTIPISSPLPGRINWVFEQLGAFQPVILGTTLRQQLAGLECDTVEICVDPEKVAPLGRVIEAMPGVTNVQRWSRGNLEFNHNGDYYYVRAISTEKQLERTLRPGHLDEYIALSADGVYSTSANQVHATRIALFDIGRLKVRAVSISAQDEASTLVGSHIKLQIPKGWSVELPIFSNRAQFRTRINNISTQLNQAALKHNAAAASATPKSRSLAA